MYRTAYDIEFDLRNLIYEHLSTLSFGFYDRVQSGQLISRANSDIRSVQMYTTFAPLILVQCSIGVIAFGFMLYYSPRSRSSRSAMMPILYSRRRAHAQAHVPDLMGHPGAARGRGDGRRRERERRRVVKAFAQEQAELRKLSDAAKKVEWAYIKDADIRGAVHAVGPEPPTGRPRDRPRRRRLARDQRLAQPRRARRVQPLLRHAPGAVHDARPTRDDGPAREGQRGAHLRDPRRADRDHRASRSAPTSQVARGGVSFRHVDFAYRDGPPIFSDLSFEIEPGESVAIVGETGTGKSTVARLLTRFYDVTGGTVEIDGQDVRDVTLGSLRAAVGIVQDEPFLFSVSIRDNIAYGRPDATDEAIEAAAVGRERPRVHRPAPRGLRHRRRRARLHALGRPAPAHRDRADAAAQPPDPRPRRRHERDRRAHRTGDPRRARRAARAPHDARDRPPALDDRSREPRHPARRGARRGDRYARRAPRDGPAVRRGPRPHRRSTRRASPTRRDV